MKKYFAAAIILTIFVGLVPTIASAQDAQPVYADQSQVAFVPIMQVRVHGAYCYGAGQRYLVQTREQYPWPLDRGPAPRSVTLSSRPTIFDPPCATDYEMSYYNNNGAYPVVVYNGGYYGHRDTAGRIIAFGAGVATGVVLDGAFRGHRDHDRGEFVGRTRPRR